MHRTGGFTLIELIVAMAIAGVLLAIATMQFSDMNRKSVVESQLKTLYADILSLRSEAMFQKRSRGMTISATSYSIYSSAETTVSPLRTTTVKYRFVSNQSAPIVFDERGLLQSAATGSRSVCIDTGGENGAQVDALVLSLVRVQQGKWQTPGGGQNDCKENNIVYR